MFLDRAEAGRQLAERLEKYRSQRPLVLALPRGGVVVGAEVARALACDLDVLLVKKLRAPGNPELALGAIAEDGRTCLNADVQRLCGVDEDYLRVERADRLAAMTGQRDRYRRVRPKVSATNRVVILVDDGLATGFTMIAAVQAVGLEQPATRVVAVPVAPLETVEMFQRMQGVDELMCLEVPYPFDGVGQFYDDFTQVTDEQVAAMLASAARAHGVTS